MQVAVSSIAFNRTATSRVRVEFVGSNSGVGPVRGHSTSPNSMLRSPHRTEPPKSPSPMIPPSSPTRSPARCGTPRHRLRSPAIANEEAPLASLCIHARMSFVVMAACTGQAKLIGHWRHSLPVGPIAQYEIGDQAGEAPVSQVATVSEVRSRGEHVDGEPAMASLRCPSEKPKYRMSGLSEIEMPTFWRQQIRRFHPCSPSSHSLRAQTRTLGSVSANKPRSFPAQRRIGRTITDSPVDGSSSSHWWPRASAGRISAMAFSRTAPALPNATGRAALPPPPPRSPRSHGALVRRSPPSPCMRGWTGTAFQAAAARSPAAAIGAGTRCLCTASNSLAIAPLRFSPAVFGQPVGAIGRRQLVQPHALRRSACRQPRALEIQPLPLGG